MKTPRRRGSRNNSGFAHCVSMSDRNPGLVLNHRRVSASQINPFTFLVCRILMAGILIHHTHYFSSVSRLKALVRRREIFLHHLEAGSLWYDTGQQASSTGAALLHQTGAEKAKASGAGAGSQDGRPCVNRGFRAALR